MKTDCGCRTPAVNTVLGRVVLDETGAGIPDLLVTVYDVDRASYHEQAPVAAIATRVPAVMEQWDRLRGDRVGSVLTDANGSFGLQYPDRDLGDDQGRARPDLMLYVTAPERAGAANCAPVLHVSCGMRQNAGRLESFLIRIPATVLEGVGLSLPPAPSRPLGGAEDIIRRQCECDELERTARIHARERVRARLGELNERRQAARKMIPGPVAFMSSVPTSLRNTTNYVGPDGNVADSTRRVIENTIAGRYNVEHFTRTAELALTDEQRRRVTDDRGNYRQDISARELTGLVFTERNPDAGAATDIIRTSPFLLCRPQRFADDGCHAEDVAPDDRPGAPTEDRDAPLVGLADLPQFVTRLVGTIATPENVRRLETAGRADTADVQTAVDGFHLRGGPADRPAYHEFHHLQIAFPHVWREVFDEETFNLVRETFDAIEDLGGDPGSAFAGRRSPDDIVRSGHDAMRAAREDPPVEVLKVFGMSAEQWTALDSTLQAEIQVTAHRYLAQLDELRTALRSLRDDSPLAAALSALTLVRVTNLRQSLAHLKSVGDNLLRYADSKIVAGASSYVRLHRLLEDLDSRLHQKYAFTIYAADAESRAVNYGLVVTYRQQWLPLGYQVGELLKTIPLAPKETRKFRRKVVKKERRAVREVENNLKSRREETALTDRWEQEIINKANTRTNFQLSTESDFNLLVASGSAKTSLERDDTQVSESVKKEFHEAVLKAAEEMKSERTVEINTETSDETEVEETGEISNPNEELPVTFLFYDLQRRYRISEQIYRVRSVILVAQEVPAPHEITEAWLVAHDWILRRVILDDSFLPALTYLSTRLPGDELAIEQLRKTMELQRQVLNDIKEEVATIRDEAGRRYAALERSIRRRADVIEENEGEGFFESIGEVFGGSSGESEEAARVREEAAKDAFERAARQEKELRTRLEREVTALNAATEAYTQALARHANARAQVARLCVHVKENILYYVQASYRHEPPDQRFFRLHTVPVPDLTGSVTYAAGPARTPNTQPQRGTSPLAFEAHINLNLPLQWTTLGEVADLDNLLGFKGNYMIFPLKAGNPLTEVMMAPYVDAALGVHDPDDIGNWTVDEYLEYVCCLSRNYPDMFTRYRDSLREEYQRLLSAPRRTSDEITVPSGSLYIEALPGAHPILEDFKLRHRAVDVLKAQAEARRAELENLRIAARLLSAEFDDPDVDRRIVVEGNSNLLLSAEGS
jgi:hypothetical protein